MLNKHQYIKLRYQTSSTLIGGKTELVQVRFTLRLRDQWSTRIQDGCKVHMVSYTTSNGLWIMVIGIIFKDHLLEIGWTQKRKTIALTQPLAYSILSCVRTHMNRNSLNKHLVEGPVTHDFTPHSRLCDHTTWFWRCPRTAFAHFLVGSHNFMVTGP